MGRLRKYKNKEKIGVSVEKEIKEKLLQISKRKGISLNSLITSIFKDEITSNTFSDIEFEKKKFIDRKKHLIERKIFIDQEIEICDNKIKELDLKKFKRKEKFDWRNNEVLKQALEACLRTKKNNPKDFERVIKVWINTALPNVNIFISEAEFIEQLKSYEVVNYVR